MNTKGRLIVMSGFSGAGKGTIVKELMKEGNYRLSISATTRSPREGEEYGKHYFFLQEKEFEQLINENKLLEYAKYVGNYYGTPRDYVEKMLNEGYDVILEIETAGALKVKACYSEALMIFVTTKSAKVLRERLIGRGTEAEEVVEKRMLKAAEEAHLMSKYDYIVVNDELDKCVKDINGIVAASKLITANNIDFINSITQELCDISKGVN